MTPAQNRVAVQCISELRLVCRLLFGAIDEAGEAGVAVMRHFTANAPDSLEDFGMRAQKALEVCQSNLDTPPESFILRVNAATMRRALEFYAASLKSLKSGLGSGLWPEKELSPLWAEHATIENILDGGVE